MRHSINLATAVLLAATGLASAQTSPGGTATGDPARSSATQGLSPSTNDASKSGSGTSTSGGKDANNDQGRDKMPDSNRGVKSLDEQGRNPNGSPK